MLNNFILAILLVGFIFLIIYVYLCLRAEVANKEIKKEEEIQMTPEEAQRKFEIMSANGDVVGAQKTAKKYLCQNPYHHDLRRLLAQSYIDCKKEYDAISNLLVLTQFYQDDLALHQQLASLYKDTHQSKKAIHFYSYVLGKDKYNINAMKNLAELYYGNKQKESALKLYKQLVAFIDDEREKINYYEIMGGIYSTYGEYEKAIGLYKKVLEAKADNIEVLKDMRRIYLKLKDTQNVIYYSRKLIDYEPENYIYYEEIIDLFFHLKEYDEALKYTEKALVLPGADIFAIKNVIGRIYLYTGRVDESIQLITQAISEDPTNVVLCQTLAMAYCMNKDFEMAKKVCMDSVEIAMPSDMRMIHNNMSLLLAEEAVFLLEQGENKIAFEKFTEAMKYNNENPEIFYKLGQANRSIKNYSEAVRQCKRAIEIAPENGLYYETLADIYYELQNYIDAKKTYKEAVKIDPNNARAHAYLGVLQSKDKEYDTAVKSLETAASLDANNPDIRYNLGLAYEVSGKKDEARAEYEKVLELDPNHKEAANNLKLL